MEAADNTLPTLTHQPAQSRFIDSAGSVLDYRIEHDGSLTVTHVEVPPQLRGLGAAARLMEAVLSYAGKAGIAVTGECSYAAAYLKRHSL